MQLTNLDSPALTDIFDDDKDDYGSPLNQEQLEPKPLSLPKNTAAAVRKRSVFAVCAMQRRARALAMSEYDNRNGMVKSSPSFCERRKRMRNKSAFISRQTHRHYEQLLVELLQSSERERDELLSNCINTSKEIQLLRKLSETLTSNLALLNAPRMNPDSLLHDAAIIKKTLDSPSHILDDTFEANCWTIPSSEELCFFE